MPEKPYNPKHKGPVPVPELELMAHPRGGIQWQCPDCGNLHSQDKGFHLRAQVQCKRDGCHHRFRVGVRFTEYDGYPCVFEGDFKQNKANRLTTAIGFSGTVPLAGRLFGLIDWQCPHCSHIQTSDTPFKWPSVTCILCTMSWDVQLLIYRPGGYPKIMVPYDWSISAKTLNNSISPEASNQSPGTSGDSPRNDSSGINQ